jgi:transcriptional regulator with PAS, ATPase and Fis domain
MTAGLIDVCEWQRAHTSSHTVEQSSWGLGKIVGAAPVMCELFGRIQRISPTDVSVLVTGESGTGKELIAETIHALNGRANDPFVAVNCGRDSGVARGGYLERAGHGTIFLDEAADMAPDMQVKLLRALESRRIVRVGGDREVPTHARVIAALNIPVAEAVSQRKLRTDLLYRLAVFHLELPALRERGDDVELLAAYFLARLNRNARTRKSLSDDSLLYLHEYSWPGNVRELYNTVQRAFILCDEELDLRTGAAYGPSLEPADAISRRMRRALQTRDVARGGRTRGHSRNAE